MLCQLGSLVTLLPLPAHAGEVGARITKAVTTSDLGISVRRSVVRGAQYFDYLDGQWEQFSDKFGLGSERSKQQSRPNAKTIPPLQPLDKSVAETILDEADRVFISVSGISNGDLQTEISNVKGLVRPSFERSGSDLVEGSGMENADQFNFESYAHFKAYADLLVRSKVDFRRFKSEFERQLGERLLAMLYPEYTPSEETSKRLKLQSALEAVDRVSAILTKKGLVAATERSEVDKDDIDDWVDGLSNIQFSLALDGDATLNAQILLQEQGFRLIPSFARYVVAVLLEQKGQQVTLEEYYMDTDYNSNPDLFEVKEVLLNVVVEGA